MDTEDIERKQRDHNWYLQTVAILKEQNGIPMKVMELIKVMDPKPHGKPTATAMGSMFAARKRSLIVEEGTHGREIRLHPDLMPELMAERRDQAAKLANQIVARNRSAYAY